MPTMKRVRRYYCDHCNRPGFWKKKTAVEHELRCWRNRSREIREGDLYPVPNWRDRGATWWPWPSEYGGDGDIVDFHTLAGWEPGECELCPGHGEECSYCENCLERAFCPDHYVFRDGSWVAISEDEWELLGWGPVIDEDEESEQPF